MIERFKIGYWYKYIGKEVCDYWQGFEGEKSNMDFVLDNKWHKCIASSNIQNALFKGMNKSWRDDGSWYWGDLKKFKESKTNPDINELIRKYKLRMILNV